MQVISLPDKVLESKNRWMGFSDATRRQTILTQHIRMQPRLDSLPSFASFTKDAPTTASAVDSMAAHQNRVSNFQHYQRLALGSLAAVIVSITNSDVATAVAMDTLSGDPAGLAARLEAQIQMDLRTDLEVHLSDLKQQEAPSLLELAEHYEEIDSRVPSDTLPSAKGDTGSSRLKDSNPEIMAASFSAGTSAMALSSSASIVASGAASFLQPASSAATGLSARLANILAQAPQHFGGGGIAGAIGATVVYPLDTIKTKMQAQKKEEDGEEPEYKNEFDCFVKMITRDGISGLYSGIGAQLLGVAPEKAMKLTVNELLLQILETFLPGTGIWMLEIIAGGGGGFSQVVFTNPVETVKVRLQTQAAQEDGSPPKNTWEVVKELGVQGLYSGSTVTMARDIPASAIFFACYTLLKQWYPEQYFLCGSLAAIPAAIIVTPADVIKTRLTIDPLPGQEPYKNGWDCIQKLVATEGVGALFKGWATRVLRVSPQFGITLMIYDMIIK